MTVADRIIRWTTAGVVVGVAAVAAVASYEHVCALVGAHGGLLSGTTAPKNPRSCLLTCEFALDGCAR